jgi:hypothetical protein
MERASVVRTKVTKLWLAVASSTVLCAACGKPAFPAELFTLDVPDADYPVMLSEVTPPKAGKGRPITAESGLRASQSQSSYYAGNTTVTITTVSKAQSEMPASAKLGAKVRRSDKWIRIERAVFSATDFATYGGSSAERILIIDATAYK